MRPAGGGTAREEDDALQQRLDRVRQRVTDQRQRVRAAHRRCRELEAAASARSDCATTSVLLARGHPAPAPPVPSHPPDWLVAGR